MPGFLDALRAKIAPVSTPAASDANPMIAELLARVRKEMPDVADAPVTPMGRIGQVLSKGALATTSPFGSVSYNPEALRGASPADIADTLTHELTHVRQSRAMSPFQKVIAILQGAKQGFGGGMPYGQRPDELEAYQAEANRAVSQGRTPAPQPSFTTPGFRNLGDVRLYP